MTSIKRIMDANFNRAREGLRVLEDLARFVLNDKKSTAKIKRIRHQVSRILLSPAVSSLHLLESRNSKRDVGKKSRIADQHHIRLNDLAAANFKRVEESLRTLEECAKMAAPRAVSGFQALRFDIYELEKGIIKKFSALRNH